MIFAIVVKETFIVEDRGLSTDIANILKQLQALVVKTGVLPLVTQR